MKSIPLIVSVFVISTFFISKATAQSKARAALAKPNILLILPDQMRASAMGCDGDTQVKSPNIDRLAAEGILFKRTYANVPVCCPARAILMTGTYPHVNGMMANDFCSYESLVTNGLRAYREPSSRIADR